MVKESTVAMVHGHKKWKIPVSFWVVAIALASALGYVAGVYHYQIEAAIGPIFGYKAHSGAIDLSTVQQTYNQLSANYDGKLDTKLLIQGANRGLVEAVGDEYTEYMPLKESTDFDNALENNIGSGIGAEIGIRNGKVTIIRAIAGNPAEKAGLVANDVVLKINDESTSGWTVNKSVVLIRGEEGTTVKLMIQRGTDIKEYNITRKVIDLPSVESKIENGIGILTVSTFNSKTYDLAKAAAHNFKIKNVKAVILDLRGNGGGYVSSAVGVAGLWLDGKVLLTERSGSSILKTEKTGRDAILSGIPTVVLVNSSSASASEIVAGALQDYKVAKLVGDKTFGKGVVQQLIQLDGGAQLKVTIAKWYTPNGSNINKSGIKPDVAIGLTQKDIDGGVDTQLNAAKKQLGL